MGFVVFSDFKFWAENYTLLAGSSLIAFRDLNAFPDPFALPKFFQNLVPTINPTIIPFLPPENTTQSLGLYGL